MNSRQINILSDLLNSKATHWAFIILMPLVFCYPILLSGNNLGISDWDFHFALFEAAYKVLIEYGQLPLWNPWQCSGTQLFQHAESSILTPFFLLGFLFKITFALKLSIYLHLVMAYHGIYLIGAKLHDLKSPLSILIASLFFVLSSSFSLHLAEGHTWVLPATYFPYIYYFFKRSVDNYQPKDFVLTSIFLSLVVFEGGAYPAPFIVFFCIVSAITESFVKKRITPVSALIIIGILALLISSIKFIPLWDFLSQFPRFVRKFETNTGVSLVNFYTSSNLNWHERSNYFGPFLILIGAITCVSRLRSIDKIKGSIHLLVPLIIVGSLIPGSFAEYSPYNLLIQLPIFKSLHQAGRFNILFTFILALTFFYLAKELEQYFSQNKNNVLLTFVISMAIFTSADLIITGQKPFFKAFPYEYNEIVERYNNDKNSNLHFLPTITQLDGYGKKSYSSDYIAVSVLNKRLKYCYIGGIPRNTADPSRPLVYSDSLDVEISNIHFTPNKVTFDANLNKPAQITLNQAYVRGWKFSLPEISTREEERLTVVNLDAGEYKEIYFHYFPNSIIVGLLFTICGIIIAAWLIMTDSSSRYSFQSLVKKLQQD